MKLLSANRSKPLWLVLYIIAIIVFVGLVPLVLGLPNGPRLVWTVAIALLPIFIVLVGYNAWRDICPLAFFTKLGQRINLGKRPKIHLWFEENYYYVTFGFMFVALTLRLLFTNADIYWLSGFLIFMMAAAFVIGLIYTGKTWCNFICPVSLIEKIYCEPNNLKDQPNSACNPCTACKKDCPDIDLENNYWKEKAKTSKKFAYYAFPGLVLGFYAYYYLYVGTWTYYFSGNWTREFDLASKIASPGFFFFPSIPKWLAAPLTLSVFSFLSFGIFQTLESWFTRQRADEKSAQDKDEIRHIFLVIASFCAFNLFYTFAGAPTFRNYPIFYQVLKFGIIVTSTAFLWKGLNRQEKDFIQERFAKGFLRRWTWGDTPPPEDLKEVYFVHTQREQEFKQRLNAYKEAIREIIQDGIATREDLNLLKRLRDQLGISESDHERVISSLSQEDRRLFDPEYEHSIEKNFQMENYRMVLEGYIMSGTSNERVFRELRQRYGISQADHLRILKQITDKGGTFWSQIYGHLHKAQKLNQWRQDIPMYSYISTDYLRYILGIEILREIENMLETLSLLGYESKVERLHRLLINKQFHNIREVLQDLQDIEENEKLIPELALILESMNPDAVGREARTPRVLKTMQIYSRETSLETTLSEILAEAQGNLLSAALYACSFTENKAFVPILINSLKNSDPKVRQTALGVLRKKGLLTEDYLQQGLQDEHPIVQNWVRQLIAAQRDPLTRPYLILVERMALLYQVPLFAQLNPQDLEELAARAEERIYPKGTDLCKEGEYGDEVHIVISGKVEVYIYDNGKKRILNLLSEGTCIGEIAVLGEVPRTATVTAIEGPVYVLVLQGSAFQQVLMDRPAIGLQVIKVISSRLLGRKPVKHL